MIAIVWLLLGTPSASASEAVVLGSMTLSSPRTAVSDGVTNFAGFGGAVGFDYHLKGNAFLETDLEFFTRRYDGNETLPTLMLPLIGRFETEHFYIGVGVYAAFIVGMASDNGGPVTLNDFGLQDTDMGGVFNIGLKFPIGQNFHLILDGRVTRALTASQTDKGPFYWGQVQAFAGMSFDMQRKSNGGQRALR